MMDPFHAVEEPGARAARKAQFARFHNDNQPGLVALLHALWGDRAHANRAAQRAFVHAWRRWRTVQSLPDPAGWTRQKARRLPPPRRRRSPAAVHARESEWIAASARPMFDALRRLPEELRTVLALHHVGGLTLGQVADSEHLPLDTVAARLASGYQALAERTGPGPRNHRGADPSQPIHTWVALELAELAHALSYRTDRRATEQVFRHAIRHRITVTAAYAAVVSLGLGGAFAVTHNAPETHDFALPPASGPSPLPAYPWGVRGGPPPGPFPVPDLLPGSQPINQDNGVVATSSVTALDNSDGSATRPDADEPPRPGSGPPSYPVATPPGPTQVAPRNQSTATSASASSSAGSSGLGQSDRDTSTGRSSEDSGDGGHTRGQSAGGGSHSSGGSHSGGGGGGGYSSSRSSGGSHSSGSDSHSGGGGHSGGSGDGGGHSGGGGGGGGHSGGGGGGGHSGGGGGGGGHGR